MGTQKYRITSEELRDINRKACGMVVGVGLVVCLAFVVLGLLALSLLPKINPLVVQDSPLTSTSPSATATEITHAGIGEYTLVLMDESCPTYPAGTSFENWISKSNDPLAPWSSTSVHFKGTDGCGKPEVFGGASLIYRYRLEFVEATELSLISVSGVAFNGPNSLLRVLDKDKNIIGSVNTFGGNSFRIFTIDLKDVQGRIFYIDEFDTSAGWRFRSSIVVK